VLLLAGGAGFIGANSILDWLRVNNEPVINLGKRTCAGNPESLASLPGDIGAGTLLTVYAALWQ
jgi:dTDP-glucose 4,6-dehydratase